MNCSLLSYLLNNTSNWSHKRLNTISIQHVHEWSRWEQISQSFLNLERGVVRVDFVFMCVCFFSQFIKKSNCDRFCCDWKRGATLCMFFFFQLGERSGKSTTCISSLHHKFWHWCHMHVTLKIAQNLGWKRKCKSTNKVTLRTTLISSMMNETLVALRN
jgi:hypothetical protein